MNEFIRYKDGWGFQMYHLAELAEAHVEKMNVMIRRLHAAGLVRRTAMLGGIIDVAPYTNDHGDESTNQATQAVLLVPEGLVVIFRDTEEMHAKLSYADMRRLFTPIGEINALLRLSYLPCATVLLAQFEDLIGE